MLGIEGLDVHRAEVALLIVAGETATAARILGVGPRVISEVFVQGYQTIFLVSAALAGAAAYAAWKRVRVADAPAMHLSNKVLSVAMPIE